MDDIKTEEIPTFPRTLEAVRRYDRKMPVLRRRMDKAMSIEEINEIDSEMNKLGYDVGEAFWEDTKHVNDRLTCRACVRPGPRECDGWLRVLLRKYMKTNKV